MTQALQAMIPQFTSNLNLQIWSQEGDIRGKLSTETSNYPLGSAHLLLPEQIKDKNTDFYLNISSMAIDEKKSFAMEFVKFRMCQYLSLIGDGDLMDGQFIARAENLRQRAEQIVPTFSGNLAVCGKYEAPTDPEHPDWRRQRISNIAGVKDRQNLGIIFEQIVEAIGKLVKMDDSALKEFREEISQYTDFERPGDDNFYFKVDFK